MPVRAGVVIAKAQIPKSMECPSKKWGAGGAEYKGSGRKPGCSGGDQARKGLVAAEGWRLGSVGLSKSDFHSHFAWFGGGTEPLTKFRLQPGREAMCPFSSIP